MYKESVSPEEILEMQIGAFSGKIVVVDTPELMDQAAQYLSTQSIIGYDTETRPSFKKGVVNSVSLLQLSSAERCFLVRLNKVVMSEAMISVLESEKIMKIGAAIHDDIRSMRKLQNFNPGGFVDLQSVVGEYGITDLSVRKIAAIVLSVRISKAQRLSNWEAQNLTESQKLYASTDAWVCREIYLKLKNI